MSDWSTASALTREFAVDMAALRSHAERGNLPMLRTSSGACVFDRARAAAIFRRRDQSPHDVGLATLGVCELGSSETSRAGCRLRERMVLSA
jgi:hypothetical protein